MSLPANPTRSLPYHYKHPVLGALRMEALLVCKTVVTSLQYHCWTIGSNTLKFPSGLSFISPLILWNHVLLWMLKNNWMCLLKGGNLTGEWGPWYLQVERYHVELNCVLWKSNSVVMLLIYTKHCSTWYALIRMTIFWEAVGSTLWLPKHTVQHQIQVSRPSQVKLLLSANVSSHSLKFTEVMWSQKWAGLIKDGKI